VKIGIPKEIKEEEYRVAAVPDNVKRFCEHGHDVLVEFGAGEGSGFSDGDYKTAGAKVTYFGEVWQSDLIMKVKEPQKSEYGHLRTGQILYTFLHLAAFPDLLEVLREARVAAIDYATIQNSDGSLPILAPMSKIAGRLAIQKGMQYLEKMNGNGRGVLINYEGSDLTTVVIIGGGNAGESATELALRLNARVYLIETNPARRQYLRRRFDACELYPKIFWCLDYNRKTIPHLVSKADILVGAVLLKEAGTPKVVTEEMIKKMKKDAVVVDISIDEGGCFETSRPTSHRDPVFVKHGVIHYCVTNMPGIVAKTSTAALTSASFPFALEIADKGIVGALRDNEALLKGVNVYGGEIVHQRLADVFQKECFGVF